MNEKLFLKTLREMDELGDWQVGFVSEEEIEQDNMKQEIIDEIETTIRDIFRKYKLERLPND